MVQKSSDAAIKDVQIKLRKEECVRDMGQRPSCAAIKDAGIKVGKEECA
jgi:hypothetical protein